MRNLKDEFVLLKIIRHRHYLPCCFEALIYLVICKLWIICRPFNSYAKKFGVAQCETLKSEMTSRQHELNAIRLALRVVPHYLPWKSVCLDQAMAAQRMVVRRGIQSTLYFGMARVEDQSLMAHAWLRSGNKWIVGYQPNMIYSIVGAYAWFK